MSGNDSANLLAADLEKHIGLLEELHNELEEAITYNGEVRSACKAFPHRRPP
jgi:hypothetical protein